MPETRPGEAGRRQVVAIVSDAILPYHHGGKEMRYREIVRRLADRADIHLYTMHWWNGPETRAEGGVTLHAIAPRLPLYAKDRRSLRQALAFGLSCIQLLGYDFDVLEADQIPFLQVITLKLVTMVKRRPFVATWHEVWGREYWREYLGPLGLAAWLVEALAIRLPDRIVAASPQTADRLRGLLGDDKEIHVAVNGIDLGVVRGAFADSAQVDIATVGRLMAHKRVEMLLEAVALLHAAGRRVTCRVIGDGPDRESLREKARELGIASAVDFRHDVTEQKDVYGLLKAASVCVFPSAREGFGIAALEALACGVPVITTSAPDNHARHLVARSVRGVVCESSASDLATAIQKILDGAVTAGEPEAWLTEYCWDATAERVAGALRI